MHPICTHSLEIYKGFSVAFLRFGLYNVFHIQKGVIEMVSYDSMTKEELEKEYAKVSSDFTFWKAQNLKLNMARGKPSKLQLDLVSDILTSLTDENDCIVDGVDVRNYGELEGLKCAREYWADVLGCKWNETFIGGASSLTLMYDVISKAYTHGMKTSLRPWCKEEKIKFLCPSPGYDRHFRITESFGFELITVAMTENGPDMDAVEELVKDPAVKGIWCVPKYSNPEGVVYSDETVCRLAALKPAAPDFIIMWDNAYCVHEFEGEFKPFADIISLCAEAGRADMVFEFASTSKITFPGAGISVMASSAENIAYMTKLMGVQMISYDKVNQLRHVRYLKDKKTTLELMKRHAGVMAPKFKMVLSKLDENIAPAGFAAWNKPTGGYFVSLNTMPGTAKRALELCAQAGVTMTGAGATYPYGIDPNDSNIRIAPSLPPVEELDKAMDVFCTCLKMASLEKLLSK